MTYLELFDSAMRCTTKEQADAWMDEQVRNLMSRSPIPDRPQDEVMARECIRSTLGYMAGYHNDRVRHKVCDLFDAVHPIFGDKRPTPEEAFALGLEMGRRNR